MLVVLLLCVCGESKPSKPGRSARVWHEAETEEDCGNFTSLHSDEKPSELCTEVAGWSRQLSGNHSLAGRDQHNGVSVHHQGHHHKGD